MATSLLQSGRTTIRLRAGTYSETAATKPGVFASTIVGNTRADTIIRGADVQFRSLTLRNLTVAPTGATVAISCGGSICNGYGGVTLTDVLVSGGSRGVSGSECALSMSRSQISGASGDGINVGDGAFSVQESSIIGNGGLGIVASSPMARIERSLIQGNNQGGINVTGASGIVRNNIIVRNGNTSAYGAVQVSSGTSFDFNTVASNFGGTTAAVHCATATPVSNNIVWGNASTVYANCTWTYSDIQGGAPGTGNLNVDPVFVESTANNFHIAGSSPVRNVGSNAGAPAVDFDGDARPSGGTVDMGADEAP